MHAVLISVEILDQERARQGLHDDVVPTVSSAPGFVAGYWVQDGESSGRGLVVMESEDAANAVAERIRANQTPDADAVRIENVRVGEVVAHA